MSRAPTYEPYLDSPDDEFRWRLGLRPLDLTDWLLFDEHAERDLARKAELIAAHPATVVVIDPSDAVRSAAQEVLDAVRVCVPKRYRTSIEGLHPLDAAGRMTQEDLVLMVPQGEQLVCGGGSVCFPNRWHLPDKVGKTMQQIHAPVPQLNDRLGRPIDATLNRLKPERPYWRLGWTITETDELYQPVDGTAPTTPTPASGAEYWLRVERETLRRFPDSGAILFTIRTFCSPLSSVPTRSRARLAAQLQSMDPDIADYKSLSTAATAITDWLRHQPIE